MSVRYSLIWLVTSIALLVIAIFPQLVLYLCELTDIQTPSNLIYLLGLLFLFYVVFVQTGRISKQAEQIKTLTQMVSIEKYLSEEIKNDEGTEKEDA